MDRLTVEQRDKLEELRAVVSEGRLTVVNEFQPDGYLRSYSVGLTTYRLPEIILYGLAEQDVVAFFDAYFAALHDPAKLTAYQDIKVGTVLAYEAERLVPLLQAVFPDGFRLMQAVLPKHRIQRASSLARMSYRQPKVYARKLRPDLLPPTVLAAEKTKRTPTN